MTDYECRGVIVDAGGGHVVISVDRDTPEYPPIWMAVTVRTYNERTDSLELGHAATTNVGGRSVSPRAHLPCPVPGCQGRFAVKGTSYRKHETTEHARCACGWMGLSIKLHRAQRRRWGNDGRCG